jgi:hypothetical protein
METPETGVRRKVDAFKVGVDCIRMRNINTNGERKKLNALGSASMSVSKRTFKKRKYRESRSAVTLLIFSARV